MSRRFQLARRPANLLLLLGSLCLLYGPLSCSGPAAIPQDAPRAPNPSSEIEPRSPQGNARRPSSPSNEATRRNYVEEGRDSPFGLDYVYVLDRDYRKPELVSDFAEVVGVRWVNFARIIWSQIEKKPHATGKRRYDWSAVDEGVRQWQEHGVHIMMSLRFYSHWATAPRDEAEHVYLKGPMKWLAKGTSDYLPKRQHWQALRDFVHNVVERYDGDGIDDMPGLRFPVLHYQMGNEYYNEVYWGGSVEAYGKLLAEVSQAARLANRDVKIILSGVGYEDLYGFYDREMDPRTRAYVEKHEPKVPPGIRKFIHRGEEFSRRTISFCDSYDILDARWPNYGIIARSRELLHEAGCPDKEIWSAEIYSFLPLLDSFVIPQWSLQPYPAPARSEEYIKVLKNRRHPKFTEINTWYRGMQAAQLVKYCMVALHAGATKLMMGWAIDTQTVVAPYTMAFSGLRSKTFDKLWPAAYTYKLTIEKLDGMTAVRRLPMPDGVYVYEFTVRGGKKVLVAFYDDHIAQDHDEPVGATVANVPFKARQATLTRIITEIDQTRPQVEQLESRGGRLRLELDEYPVFLEPRHP